MADEKKNASFASPGFSIERSNSKGRRKLWNSNW